MTATAQKPSAHLTAELARLRAELGDQARPRPGTLYAQQLAARQEIELRRSQELCLPSIGVPSPFAADNTTPGPGAIRHPVAVLQRQLDAFIAAEIEPRRQRVAAIEAELERRRGDGDRLCELLAKVAGLNNIVRPVTDSPEDWICVLHEATAAKAKQLLPHSAS